jgi:large subunit ribosomal protein L16
MGSGKGDIDEYVAVIRPGRIIFEVGGVDVATARKALDLAAQKLPIKTAFVQREVMGRVE